MGRKSLMREIENNNIKEKCYMERLDNGLQVIIIPKQDIQKKYIIWATKFGSIDNTFIDSTTGEEVVIMREFRSISRR